MYNLIRLLHGASYMVLVILYCKNRKKAETKYLDYEDIINSDTRFPANISSETAEDIKKMDHKLNEHIFYHKKLICNSLLAMMAAVSIASHTPPFIVSTILAGLTLEFSTRWLDSKLKEIEIPMQVENTSLVKIVEEKGKSKVSEIVKKFEKIDKEEETATLRKRYNAFSK